MTSNLGAIEHVTTNHGDPFNWFVNPNNQASSHFWISDDGELEQMVDTDYASWAQAGGNYQYVSVETSGVPEVPLTPAQVDTFARLYAWGHNVHGWPLQMANMPGQRGLGWHGMGGDRWGGHYGCPGVPRMAQRALVLTKAQSILRDPSIKGKTITPIDGQEVTVASVCRRGDGRIDKLTILRDRTLEQVWGTDWMKIQDRSIDPSQIVNLSGVCYAITANFWLPDYSMYIVGVIGNAGVEYFKNWHTAPGAWTDWIKSPYVVAPLT